MVVIKVGVGVIEEGALSLLVAVVGATVGVNAENQRTCIR